MGAVRVAKPAWTPCGVEALTVFAMSTENLRRRDPREVGLLRMLFEETLRREAPVLAERGVRLRGVGEPLWGAGFAFVLLGETMGPQCQLGGMLMVLACVVSSTGGEMGSEMAPLSPAELALSARARLQAAQGTAAAALARLLETSVEFGGGGFSDF